MSSKGKRFQNRTRIPGKARRRNRWLFVVAATLAAAGCAGDPSADVPVGVAFRGAAVADEPQAAQAAADILVQGGSAADAAVALYFTLSVTYPAAASMGGGGVCMINDRSTGEVHALNFLAPRPASSASAVRVTAVPANVRGMAALHARYGDLDWRTVLAPAERIARFGKPLTRASARALEGSGSTLMAQWEARRIFAPTGALAREGQTVAQTDLADTIAALRLKGASTMYTGPLGDRLVAAVRQAGGSLAREDLRNFLPGWQTVQGVRYGNDMAYFAPPPAGAGLLAGQMWEMLADGKRYGKANSGEREHLLVETARRAWDGRGRWLADDGTTVDAASLLSTKAARAAMADYDPNAASRPGGGNGAAPAGAGDPASTGFVVLDVLGDAVACSFTAYRPFGIGAVAPGTGILLAPAPGPEHRNPQSLGPMILFNRQVRSFKFAAVGGSGSAAATAMMSVAAESVLAGGRLDKALARSRVHAGDGPGVFIESSAGDAERSALADRGHALAEVPSLGRVNAIYCPPGYPVEPTETLCWAENDPRGYGFVAFPR
jgi:gamma-glutamyltranspeptidase/glutathione hydrolase